MEESGMGSQTERECLRHCLPSNHDEPSEEPQYKSAGDILKYYDIDIDETSKDYATITEQLAERVPICTEDVVEPCLEYCVSRCKELTEDEYDEIIDWLKLQAESSGDPLSSRSTGWILYVAIAIAVVFIIFALMGGGGESEYDREMELLKNIA